MKLKNGKELKMEVSVGSVEIPHSNYLCEEVTIDGVLDSVTFDADINIRVGDKLPIEIPQLEYSTNYLINKITKNEYNYIFTEYSWNKANYFLLPLLVDSLKLGNINIALANFINCYINTTHADWNDKSKMFYLAYRFTPDEYFELLDSKLSELSNYIGKFDDGNVRVYCLKVIPRYLEDYDKIINNKFNNLSDSYLTKVKTISKLSDEEVLEKLEEFEIDSCTSTREYIATEFGVNIEDVPKNLNAKKALKYSKTNSLIYQIRE